MKLLKSTKFATSVAVIVCVLSMFIGTNKSLAALSSKTEDKFYSGTQAAEGYTQPSIDSQLAVRADSALGLVTFARNYPELSSSADVLNEARIKLVEAQTVEEKSRANSELGDAVSNLLGDIDGIEIADNRAITAIDDYENTFFSAGTFIEELTQVYNAEVAKYEKAAGSFPANIFGLFVKAPDAFL